MALWYTYCLRIYNGFKLEDKGEFKTMPWDPDHTHEINIRETGWFNFSIYPHAFASFIHGYIYYYLYTRRI